MQPIKDRILDYIVRNHFANASELSYTLGVTKPNIHYHIKKLIQSGILEIYQNDQVHNTKKKGRPEIYYIKANKSKPNNYKNLSSHLLKILFNDHERENDLQVKFQHLASAIAAGAGKADNFVQQIQLAVTKLESLNYDPHWEISKTGPLILLRNCPYAEILTDHPVLCQMDTALLRYLTGASINQVACILDQKTRPPACVFSIVPF